MHVSGKKVKYTEQNENVRPPEGFFYCQSRFCAKDASLKELGRIGNFRNIKFQMTYPNPNR